MEIQKRQEYLPEEVAIAMTVVVEKRTLIVERSKNPNASTGTPISDLNGMQPAAHRTARLPQAQASPSMM